MSRRNKSRLVVDLDDEVEFVTKVAKQTTRGVRYVDVPLPMPTGSNVPSPSKSPSKAPASGSLFNLDDGDILGNIGVLIQLDPVARKTKTQNDFMRDWIPHRDDYLHAIVEMEAPPEPRNCAECKVDLNAHDGEVSDDGEVPFNFAPLAGALDGEVRQTDDAPDPTWEEDVPPVLSRPPRRDSYGNRIIVIVDISGVHHIGVDWCQCEMAVERDMQLLQMGLYPGTVKDPHTAFTFAVLDDFLLENKECKTAALNYYSKLKRVTSNAFPGTIPISDHYRELMRVSCQWRQFKYRKWHGFSHNALHPVEKGGLAIFCPTCPQPGLNLPFDWQADPVQWKFKHGFVIDGNFSAEHMKMKHPEEDVALSDGQAFMVGQEDYKAHLAVAMESHQRSTCHEHRAVNQANVDRANLDATGIGATACARHGFFVPHTVVDFQKGERQMNMDYSLSNALLTLTGITLVLVMYDIMCQYGIHVRKRFCHSAYLRMPFELKVDQGIGLFHVHGHQDCCFQRFLPNFIVGAVLDDHMNDSNWKKTTRMVPTLMTKWKRVLLGFPRSKESFEALSASTDEDVLEAWQKEYDDAMEARQNDPKIMDTFDVQLMKAPGKDLTQLRLAGEESAKGLEKGTAGWLSTGLKIQEAQLKLANDIRKAGQNPSVAEDLKTLEHHQHLEVSILTFQRRSEKFMGRLKDVPAMEDRDDGALWDSLDENPFQIHLEDAEYGEDAISPERASLNLPSQIRFVAAVANGLQTLAAQELELRKGLMNDILHELHMALGLKSYLYRKRVRPANSVGTMTRAQAEVHAADQTVLACARLYSANRRAIMCLGATDEDLALYRPLDKKDLHVKTAVIEASTSGLRNVNLAWFWTMDVAGDRGSSEWMDEFYRVNWLRARARYERWREERVLVHSEMAWTIATFKRNAERWAHWLEMTDPSWRGHVCYAARQSSTSDARPCLFSRGRLQLEVYTWRIQEAVLALEPDPDHFTKVRWEEGLRREMFAVRGICGDLALVGHADHIDHGGVIASVLTVCTFNREVLRPISIDVKAIPRPTTLVPHPKNLLEDSPDYWWKWDRQVGPAGSPMEAWWYKLGDPWEKVYTVSESTLVQLEQLHVRVANLTSWLHERTDQNLDVVLEELQEATRQLRELGM
ncbi:hypothetical protein SCP_0211800 [Sparassis crispa]|uniref:CxC2-like cysteine cluster KDZ transposase-associated domain-containing protein n=1 Tax=Sparassis crispa TaxID=139825 RepID=A0A401GCR6_9APHY|nr:hypothetical protein SCP_0211800 [Sparassis crispa]GBE79978.1 hypothetical protein SCP_0211800 [Sparassis crispa]